MSTDAPAPTPNFPPPPPQQQPEPAAPKKKSLVVRILTTLAGIVVAALVVYGFNYFTSDAAQSKAGECASLTGTPSKPDFKTVDCGSSEANYTIGKVLGSLSESCGTDYYDEYTETARRGPDSKLCLVPNLKEGSCYELDNSSTVGYPPVDCGKSGVMKLVKLVKGSADESACTDGAPMTFSEPKQTFCFAPAESA
ncbi:LppU/SCO3897 family protein [Saccharothrix obliqua]|uniref:LppU/SCO3897 family protein n=1 Tax=Saccharothrix obliqua TaxID=2861747 RepID=UPI001C5DFC1D|nr:hypothetical protein [Saccharothrix obliqua]MBW4718957.1 hypothetical protein [Saccharothrix obliqua]